MSDLDRTRRALEWLVVDYYERQILLFTTVLRACELAIHRVEEVINRRQDEEIAKLQKALDQMNRNQANGSFFLDLAFAIVSGPILGHLFELGLKKLAHIIIEDRETMFKLSKQIDVLAGGKRWSEIAAESFTPQVSRKVETIIIKDVGAAPTTQNLQKFFAFFTPLANDAAQVVGQKTAEALADTGKSKKQQLSSDTIKDQYARLASMNKLPLSDVLDGVQNYVAAQQDTTLKLKGFAQWLVHILPEEDLLYKMSKQYSKDADALPMFSNTDLKEDIALLFEAMMWVYYLGKPEKWGSERYPGGYATTLELQDTDLEHVFTFSQRLPRSLFDYLLTRFRPPGSKESFLQNARKRKVAALGRQSGYGINQRDPNSGWTWRNHAPYRYIQGKPDIPIQDPSSIDYTVWDLAAQEMVSWFKQLDKALTDNEHQLASMLARIGIKSVEPRTF